MPDTQDQARCEYTYRVTGEHHLTVIINLHEFLETNDRIW